VPAKEYEAKKDDRVLESQQRSSRNVVYLIAPQDDEIDNILVEIYRCREIYKQNRNKAADKDVEEYLRAQDQRVQNLDKDLEFRLKKTLSKGSFVFRAKPRSVAEFDIDIIAAVREHLDKVAEQVFEKFSEAPVQAESGLAERFLKTDNLEKIPSKDDPLELVKKGGASSPIDLSHPAIVSIKDYLDKYGQVEGRRLLDDFYAPKFGWSKDTTRYILAAMLVSGIVKLRISGDDIKVRGDAAIGSLKNTNSFNKIGIALRDAEVDPPTLLRARDRLLDLTGEEIMPLEEDISKCVMRHFPDFQQAYAPLAIQLENLELQGTERAQSIQDNLAEILKGDASDAANRLGGKECPLFEDLSWAREVKKAFDNGIGEIIQTARNLLAEIPKLPGAGIPGKLAADSEPRSLELAGSIARDDFYNHITAMQNSISEIQNLVESATGDFTNECTQKLEAEKTRLQNLPEWNLLGTDEKVRLGAELDDLSVQANPDLNGLKKLINDEFLFASEIARIEEEIRAAIEDRGGVDGGGPDFFDVVLEAPRIVAAADALDDLIQKLQDLKIQLKEGHTIKITWR